MKNNNKNSHTERYPTATRAATMLLRISTQQSLSRSEPTSIVSDYHLCPFSTEDVLSFCIDATRVLVVDITSIDSDFSRRDAPTCLVVDDHGGSSALEWTAWNQTSPPQHFIFGSMCYRRALDWVQQWKFISSIDMHQTYDISGTFDGLGLHNIVELTLPSTVAATSLANSGLTSVDLSTLTNVSCIGNCFLAHCSALASLDASPLKNVSYIGNDFLCGCSALTFLDLSPLHVGEIQNFFLCGCSALASADLSPLASVSKIGGSFLNGCSALTSLDLSPLTNVRTLDYCFLYGCSGLTGGIDRWD
eukprot:PhM_4_TR8363/c4_g1_i3/m.14648